MIGQYLFVIQYSLTALNKSTENGGLCNPRICLSYLHTPNPGKFGGGGQVTLQRTLLICSNYKGYGIVAHSTFKYDLTKDLGPPSRYLYPSNDLLSSEGII